MIRKYTLVEDEYLVGDLEDEFRKIGKPVASSINASDVFNSMFGVGDAWIYPDENGPIKYPVIYLLIRETSEEVSLCESRYVKSITKVEDAPDCCGYYDQGQNKSQSIEIKSEWYLVEDIVDEQAILDQKLKMMRV